MKLGSLGELYRDKDLLDWFVSKPIAVPCFGNKEIPFILEGFNKEDDKHDFSQAIAKFMDLTVSDVERISASVYENYLEFCSLVSEEDIYIDIESKDEVWQYVDLSEILVKRGQDHEEESVVYLVVLAECEWEVEHGLQLSFKGGFELARVGAQDGMV